MKKRYDSRPQQRRRGEQPEKWQVPAPVRLDGLQLQAAEATDCVDVLIVDGEVIGIVPSSDSAPLGAPKPTTFVIEQLKLGYDQTRRQAQNWSNASLVAALLGVGLLSLGTVAFTFGWAAGSIGLASGVITKAVAALFFAQSKSANKSAEAIQTRLTEVLWLHTAFEFTETIGNDERRDELKGQIVLKALGVKKRRRKMHR